ncbi:MAG TPA: hypothetical protein VEB42_02775, partial [Chitinophagaceae bacterium]|nr:hypothetical protein [Chitinophagaceae bacterium]
MSQVNVSHPARIIVPVATAVMSIAFFFVALINGWFGLPEGVGSVFCERPRPGLIKQPANTWSNLAFMATGLIAAFHLWKGTYHKQANHLTRSLFYSIFFCCLVIMLGPSSMAMHATTSYVGGFLDMMCMYLIAAFMTAYATERFFKLKPVQFLLIFVAVLVICVWAFDKNYYVLFDNFGS